jgi:hypothetical protein
MIDVNSVSDCQELMERIQQTLLVKGYKTSRIGGLPKPFPLNDAGILEGLSEAILTRQALWISVKRILPELKVSLSNYNVNGVAALTDNDIGEIYISYKDRVKARFFEDELFAIRYNAIIFQQIIFKYGSVCTFIKSYLPMSDYDSSSKCYIRPIDAALKKYFIDYYSGVKLHCVGLAICCEFFNNIGIDDFKPDVHTTSFLNRITLDKYKVRVSHKAEDVRGIGVLIANTLKKPRKYVDSHIWHLCAEGEGQVCTENDPQCSSCWLKIKEPILCGGFPNKAEILDHNIAAADRFKECNLSRKEAYKKMSKAGIDPLNIEAALSKAYNPST